MLWGEVSVGPRGEGEEGDLGGLSWGKGQTAADPVNISFFISGGRWTWKTCGPHLLAPGPMISTEPLFPAVIICPAVGQGRW